MSNIIFVKTETNRDQYWVADKIDQLCGKVPGRWVVVAVWTEAETVCYEIKYDKAFTLVNLGALDKVGKLVTHQDVVKAAERHQKIAEKFVQVTQSLGSYNRYMDDLQRKTFENNRNLKQDIESCFYQSKG